MLSLYIISLLNCCFSENPPKVDESDIGNRDPALKSTYKGLVNIRCVFKKFKHYIYKAN